MRSASFWALLGAVVIALNSASAQASSVESAATDPSAVEVAASESAAPLTLAQVLANVERSFPQLKLAELERAVADAELLSAEGGFDVSWKTKGTLLPVSYYESVRLESVLEAPTALWGTTAFAGWRLGRGEFPVYEGKSQTLEYGEVRAGVHVPLWRNGPIDRRRTTLGRSELAREIASLNVTGQRVEVARMATLRYWTWVAAGQRLSVAQDLLRIAVEREAGIAERVAQGDLAAYERIDNARAIEQRRAQVAAAARGVEQAAIDLSLLLRDPQGRPLTPAAESLPAALPEPGPRGSVLASDLATAKERRVELRRFALHAKSSELEHAFAKNQLRPAIDLQLAGAADLGGSMRSRPDLSQPVLELSLSIELPLQTRLMRGRAQAASAQAARARVQLGYADDVISAEVRDAHSALRAASERIEATQREVAFARSLEAGERTRFDQGDSHLLMVNLREQQTAEARLREIDALLDYQRASAALNAARGDAGELLAER